MWLEVRITWLEVVYTATLYLRKNKFANGRRIKHLKNHYGQ